MKINNIPLNKIKVYPRIRTKIERKANITELTVSIKRFGLLQPIVVNQDNELIAGFRRLNAFHELKLIDSEKYSSIPCVIIETESEEYRKILEFHENSRRLNLMEYEKDNYRKGVIPTKPIFKIRG